MDVIRMCKLVHAHVPEGGQGPRGEGADRRASLSPNLQAASRSWRPCSTMTGKSPARMMRASRSGMRFFQIAYTWPCAFLSPVTWFSKNGARATKWGARPRTRVPPGTWCASSKTAQTWALRLLLLPSHLSLPVDHTRTHSRTQACPPARTHAHARTRTCTRHTCCAR